jgi:hypothetical protein
VSVVKWTFYDGVTTYTHEINPNRMSSPLRPRPVTSFATSAKDGAARSMRQPEPPHEWRFGGVVRSEAQYNNLLLWSQKTGVITITDHLGRDFQCLMLAFGPDEQRPTARTAWRFEYEMTVLVVGGDQ